MSQSHLCSIKILITRNTKRCSAPKVYMEMISEVKNITKDVSAWPKYQFIPILCRIYAYCLIGVLSKIHSPLLLHPSSFLFCPCDLSTFCLTDPPDLMTTHRRDTQKEKRESEWEPKAKTSRVGFIAAYRSESSHFLPQIRLLFSFTCSALYLQFIPLSFSVAAIHFDLPLKIPVPSQAFISNDHPSLFLYSFSEWI